MLIEFEVENERSFASASTISMVASKLKEDRDCSVRQISTASNLNVLTSAIILGKNGSGKSSLIDALDFVSTFVRTSAMDEEADAKLPYEPNLLMDGFKEIPTSMKVMFSVEESVYVFGFSYDEDKICEEYLSVSDKSARFRKMYERKWDDLKAAYDYSFGEALTGNRRVWSESTRLNALYISTAVQLNSQDLKAPYEWLTKFLRSISIGNAGKRFTTEKCREDESFRRKVVSFLQSMDINVLDFEFEEEDRDLTSLEKTFSKEFLEQMKSTIERSREKKNYRVFFQKEGEGGGQVRFPLSRESTGTQALFCLAGPLFDVLENGYCLLIDELNTSLHPIIVKFLIEMFDDKAINKNDAQLLFTSHDVSVLREEILRRDQIWFMEHDGKASTIVPLSDFSPRKKEAIERGYLSGRYGGVPSVVPSFLRHLV